LQVGGRLLVAGAQNVELHAENAGESASCLMAVLRCM
jgi:hypothetical protein